MCFRLHSKVNNITARANKTPGFIKRNLRGCKTSARARAYEAIVRPTLEYAASIWDPYNTGQINQLEKVQRRATFTFRIIDGHIEFPYYRLFFDKSNKRSIKLKTAVTWSKSNLNMMNIYEEGTLNFWICS
jgi:hypothetical protein